MNTSTSIFTLTETEVACGVTLSEVQALSHEVRTRAGHVVLPEGTQPELAAATARWVLGADAHFLHLTARGQPIYAAILDAAVA